MTRFEIDLNKRNLGQTLNYAKYVRYCEETGRYIIWGGYDYIFEVNEDSGRVVKSHKLSKQTKTHAEASVNRLIDSLSQKEG